MKTEQLMIVNPKIADIFYFVELFVSTRSQILAKRDFSLTTTHWRPIFILSPPPMH